ncbi:MAG: type II secretion system GspH family protein [Kiritimatiellae bacterium]|nr:type II secretion system GspH family protein [Kiritimatiellia bacterium]
MAKGGNNRGFTLIELLIVVVVIATMMGILFRLAGVGGDQKARNVTITRMQKLEFALSGYYAAFGSYPPVQLHGSRDIFCGVSDYGVQYTDTTDSGVKKLDWARVRAACLSQPVAVEFPLNQHNSETMLKMFRDANSSLSSVNVLKDGSKGSFPDSKAIKKAKGTLWQKTQQFKFGVLSFLLPRYLFMLEGPNWMYDGAEESDQWNSQNDLRTIFNFENGRPLYSMKGKNGGVGGSGWQAMQEDTQQNQNSQLSKFEERWQYKRLLMQPSQAVCARWMQAFDGLIYGGRIFFGVNTMVDHNEDYARSAPGGGGLLDSMWRPVYAPSHDGKPTAGSGGNTYMLDEMTIVDGWNEDLFYYSEPPYQSYRVWSAGPNGKTIPPWVDFESADMKNVREEGARWIADDIVGLSTPAN